MIVAAIAVAAHAATVNPADVAVINPSPTATPTIVATATPSPTSSPAPAVPAATVTPAASPYKVGTYSASATYMTPDNDESISVSITLKSGIVTNSAITTSGSNMQSKHYQDKFASGYKPYVIGKQIAAIHLSRVSGSSLTSGGFNDAISQIKSRAL